MGEHRYDIFHHWNVHMWLWDGPSGDIMATDPICNMTVDESSAQFTSVYKGQKFFFCAPGCKKLFDTDPENYSTGGGPGHMPE